ncbi:zinc finger protein 41-like isoform X2 [Fopius arisanus]|uniref:Zinc finger protein 41-like isoform X2 n=1 Tax=Fopius arisanus TaxID=64838 RepID=A0A9R1TXY8_9HYME|nr:PREDICTED: zinc finger protein 41-like isoform X2 [Fopius arisanus]
MDSKVDASKPIKICRLCLKTGQSYRSLFEEKNKIAEKVSKCLPILVNPNDDLPSHICPLCLRSLNISYKLLIQAIETDGKLRKQLSESRAQRLILEPRGTVSMPLKSQQMEAGNPGICGICEIRFEDAEAFDSHMEMFHHSKWVCNLCETDFTTSEELLQHKHKTHYDNMECTEAPENCIDEGIIDIKEERITSASEHSDAEEFFPAEAENGKKRRKEKQKVDEEMREKPVKERRTREICKTCGITLDRETSLREHMKMHEPYDVECAECQDKFTTAYDFCVHKRDFHNSHPGRPIKFFCRLCNRMMWDIRALKVHANCKRPRHTCKYCLENFCVKNLLRLHLNKEHRQAMMEDEAIEKMSCAYCQKLFVDKKIYYDHVYQTHERIHLKLHCKRCKKKFETVELVNQHMKDVHGVPLKIKRLYSCPQCDRKFTRRSVMEDHKNTHSGKTPQTCTICHKKFRTYAARWAHVQRHGSNGFFCDYCQKKFLNKRHMKSHIMSHRPPEEWEYICEVCDARFPQKFRLTNHKRKHTGEKKYLCDICGSKFGQKSNLDKHMRNLHIAPEPQESR